MKVTAQGFAELTRIVTELADSCCAGRVVSVLEGGYGPEGLPDSVAAHLRALTAE
jgi:acetoin utilization deacetylase AcuC-like enzyme